MSYNARIRARQKRATCSYYERGWEVGSDQSGAIGIPARLVKKITDRTCTTRYTEDGTKFDSKNLVVQQNTLSGVGRYRSQFNVDADGIINKRFMWVMVPPSQRTPC